MVTSLILEQGSALTGSCTGNRSTYQQVEFSLEGKEGRSHVLHIALMFVCFLVYYTSSA